MHHQTQSTTARSSTTRTRRRHTLAGKTYIVKLPDNRFCTIVETDRGTYFDITGYAIHPDGSIPEAIRLTESYAKSLIYPQSRRWKASVIKELHQRNEQEEKEEATV